MLITFLENENISKFVKLQRSVNTPNKNGIAQD